MKTPSRFLALSIAVLWCVMVGLAALGLRQPALYVLLLLFGAHLVMGCSRAGRIDRRVLVFPILVWLVVWGAAFAAAEYFAAAHAGEPPPFVILGFHPSFAMIVLLYWLLGTAVLAGGYYLMRDRWLSAADWQRLVDSVRQSGDEP